MISLNDSIINVITQIFNDLKNSVFNNDCLQNYDNFHMMFYLNKTRFDDTSFNEQKILEKLNNSVPEYARKILSITVSFQLMYENVEKILIRSIRRKSTTCDNFGIFDFTTIGEYLDVVEQLKPIVANNKNDDEFNIICSIPKTLSNNLDTVYNIKRELLEQTQGCIVCFSTNNSGKLSLHNSGAETNMSHIMLNRSIKQTLKPNYKRPQLKMYTQDFNTNFKRLYLENMQLMCEFLLENLNKTVYSEFFNLANFINIVFILEKEYKITSSYKENFSLENNDILKDLLNDDIPDYACTDKILAMLCKRFDGIGYSSLKSIIFEHDDVNQSLEKTNAIKIICRSHLYFHYSERFLNKTMRRLTKKSNKIDKMINVFQSLCKQSFQKLTPSGSNTPNIQHLFEDLRNTLNKIDKVNSDFYIKFK